MNDNFFLFPLGSLRCVVLADGRRPSSVAQTFPHIPAAELAATLQTGPYPDEFTVGYNVLFVDTGEHKVLIDSGLGSGLLPAYLAQAGIDPADINWLIITHGDGDHIGGLAGFPNAQIVMWQGAWDLWTTTNGRNQMIAQFTALFQEKTAPEQLAQMAERRAAYGRDTLPALAHRITQVALETEFLPGFRLVAAPGHRSDHVAVEIISGGETLLHVVDALRHPIQAQHPEWASFIDSDPAQTAVTNPRLLTRAANSLAIVLATHMPFPGLGRIRPSGSAWEWHPYTNG